MLTFHGVKRLSPIVWSLRRHPPSFQGVEATVLHLSELEDRAFLNGVLAGSGAQAKLAKLRHRPPGQAFCSVDLSKSIMHARCGPLKDIPLLAQTGASKGVTTEHQIDERLLL